MEKWQKYRERIEALPEEAFPPHDTLAVPLSLEDQVSVNESSSISSLNNVVLGKKGKRGTPYANYRKRERVFLILEIAAFFIVVVLFVLLYLFWVVD